MQICPVGALTAKPFRFKARPWDIQTVESTCTTCAVGCRITIDSSRDRLLRYQGIDDDAVNWGWMCDRGRFNFEAVNSEDRLGAPLVRKPGAAGDELVEVSWAEAIAAAAGAIREAVDAGGPGSVAVLGGARGTNEDAYAWAKLAKGVIGTDHVDAQLGDGLPAEAVFGLPAATIDELCAATTVVLLGPDLKEELPVLFLRLRDAAERRAIRILELSERETGLTPYAWRSVRHRPGEQAALVRALVGSGPVAGLGVEDDAVSEIREQLGRGAVVAVVGRANVASGSVFTVDAAAALLAAHPQSRFLVALRRGNVRGALEMGLAPGMLPGRAALGDAGGELRGSWPLLPPQPGLDAAGILEAAATGRIGCLILLGADPLADFPDRDLARRALAGPGKVVALDAFITDSSKHADVVLAAATFGEKSGTTTNLEGRVSPVTQKVTAAGTSMEDWMVAVELAERLGADLQLDSVAAIAAEVEAVAGTPSSFPVTDSGAVAPTVNNYDFRLVVDRELYDAAVFTARSPSLADLPRGAAISVNPWDADRRGFAEGTPVQVIAARTSVVLPARPDGRVPAWHRPPRRQPARRRRRRAGRRQPPRERRAPRTGREGMSRAARARSARRRRRRLRRGAHRRHQGRRGLRGDAHRRHPHDLVRAQGDRRHAEPHRAEQGRARGASCRRWPTASSWSSRSTSSPSAPTASCSSWRPTSPWCRCS